MLPLATSSTTITNVRQTGRFLTARSSELRTLRRLSILAKVAGDLSRSTSEASLREAVATTLRQLFEPTRAVEFFIAGESGKMCPLGDARTGAQLLAWLGVATGTTADRVLWKPNFVPAHLAGGRGALISVPVLEGGQLYGVLAVEGDPSGPDMSFQDLETLCAVAGQVALLLPSARVEQARDLARFQHDLALAGRIQRQFLPLLPREVRGVRVAADYRPAFDIGGDFYGLVQGENGTITAIIGDVSGHGIAAALVMSRISCDFHRLAKQGIAPADILGELNRSASEQFPDDTFATALCMRIDVARGIAQIANAGHPPPLVRRHGSTEVLLPELPTGTPLGVVARTDFTESSFALRGGDVFVLTTDGVIDALAGQRTAEGLASLCAIVASAHGGAVDVNRSILDAVERESSGRSLDDVAILTLQLPETLTAAAA